MSTSPPSDASAAAAPSAGDAKSAADVSAAAPASRSEALRWWLLVGPAMLVGACLRLYLLPDQLLVDDEWHSLNFVIDRSFFQTVATHGMGANCVPQNVTNWLLLHTTGWCELVLRGPSVACGLAGLFLFPVLVARLFGRAPAVPFAWLLALSPCATFYARLVRPYSMVMFFGFLSLLALVAWMKGGRTRLLWAYGACGFVALWYHLYAAVPILFPLVCLAGIGFGRRLLRLAPPRRLRLPTFADLFVPAVAVGVPAGLLIVPQNLAHPWWSNVLGVDRVTGTSVLNFLTILAGAPGNVARFGFVLLLALGLGVALRREPALGLVSGSVLVAFVLYLLNATQDGMHAAIQIARYGIVVFPLAYLLVALGLERIREALVPFVPRFPAAAAVVPAAFLLLLAWKSPLHATYTGPNGFTNHSAFQDSYEPIDWSRSRVRDLTPMPTLPQEQLAPFYRTPEAVAEFDGLVAYPLLLGDPIDLHYYAQHFHRRRVVAGYLTDLTFGLRPAGQDFITADTVVDYVLVRLARYRPEAIRFRNLVALDDPVRLAERFPGWGVVVHRNALWLTPDEIPLPPEHPPDPASRSAANRLAAAFGNPRFADGEVQVWAIPRRAEARIEDRR